MRSEQLSTLHILACIYFAYPTPISRNGGLGVLELSDTSDLSLRQRFENVIRLDCASQQRKALNRKNAGDSKIYVPTCSAKNSLLYDKVQCYDMSAYCWCVDEISGEPKIGSSTSRGKPKCQEDPTTTSTPPKRVRRNNRCKEKKRTRFLRRLVATLKSEMIMSGVNATQVSRDAALRWKFNQLDANHNGLMERAEWKTYKAVLLEWKNVRQCSRSLFKTCDLDRNRKLTFDEWRKCIVQEINRVPAKRPDQLNPFLYILRPE
uniref:Thyroglobulin type-1 domain-containing protein n=1 Tax=Caenorhabditis japonica TaxID=281687 RepID=A0A8R1DN21_CAEJA